MKKMCSGCNECGSRGEVIALLEALVELQQEKLSPNDVRRYTYGIVLKYLEVLGKAVKNGTVVDDDMRLMTKLDAMCRSKVNDDLVQFALVERHGHSAEMN